MRRLFIALSIVFAISVHERVACADTLSAVDLQQLFSQHSYQDVVKGATDALAPGGITDPGDRFKVALLKAESLLQLRDADAAARAFTAAAAETTDPRLSATPTATAYLIAHSNNFIYNSRAPRPIPKYPRPATPAKPPAKLPAHPQATSAPTSNPSASLGSASTKPATAPVVLGPGQFDIVPPLRRPLALASLWVDEKADAEKAIKDKLDQHAIPPVVEALDIVKQNDPLAIAAGNPEWPTAVKGLLVAHVRLDLAASMKDMTAQVDAIAKSQAKRRGKAKGRTKPMDQGDRTTLNGITESLSKTDALLKDLPTELGIESDAFEQQHAAIAKLTDRATTVLAQD